jgi:alanyl-tRNA synthetase
MLGIQVFNYPDKYVFFKDECVEFNYRWLTDELEIESDQITFVEDVWAGGGNLGPSIEYFVNGLELGNMVFMQYKTFHDGSREELPIKIIDVGIGLERVSWLINGSETSYLETFKNALKFLSEKLEISTESDIWKKFGPYSSKLDVDEAESIDETWKLIAKEIGEDENKIKNEIAPIRDMYIILDHSRTIFMIIYDGSLPSNVGGGSNVRNILRRIFAILKRNNWLDKLKIEGLVDLMFEHIKDMEGIMGKFTITTNFKEIIQLEFDKWIATDDQQKDQLNKLLKKKKGVLSIDDWILAMQSWGLPADSISDITKLPIPGNLYYEISQKLERTAKAQEQVLYDTTHLPETENIFYAEQKQTKFEAKILEVLENKTDKNFKGKKNIVILDRSCFYPTSGGQQHDTGFLFFNQEKYEVLNVEKVGKCSLHILDRELTGDVSRLIGIKAEGEIDLEKRYQLMCHHTGTHVVFSACRKVLGKHIWQNGAKKTIDQAHLDITHYRALTEDEKVIN